MPMVARAEPGCAPVKLEVRCTPGMLARLLLLVRMGLPEKNGSAASAADCFPAAGQLPTRGSFCARDCSTETGRRCMRVSWQGGLQRAGGCGCALCPGSAQQQLRAAKAYLQVVQMKVAHRRVNLCVLQGLLKLRVHHHMQAGDNTLSAHASAAQGAFQGDQGPAAAGRAISYACTHLLAEEACCAWRAPLQGPRACVARPRGHHAAGAQSSCTHARVASNHAPVGAIRQVFPAGMASQRVSVGASVGMGGKPGCLPQHCGYASPLIAGPRTGPLYALQRPPRLPA